MTSYKMLLCLLALAASRTAAGGLALQCEDACGVAQESDLQTMQIRASPAAGAHVAPEGYVELAGDCQGNDMGEPSDGSAQDCANRCSATEECVGFSLEPSAGMCIIKNGTCTEPSTTNGFLFYEKQPPAGYTRLGGDCQGNDIAELAGLSTQNCSDFCSADEGCAGFSYRGLDGLCIKKSAACINPSKTNEFLFYAKLRECTDNDAEIIAFAKEGNHTVVGCADPFVVASCNDVHFGPQVKERCCATCNAAPQGECADDDAGIVAFAKTGNFSVTGCADSFVLASCFDSYVGSQVRELCCATCSAAPCADHDDAIIGFVAAGTWSGQKVSVTGCSDPFVSAHCRDDQVGGTFSSMCCSTCSGSTGSESGGDGGAGPSTTTPGSGQTTLLGGCADDDAGIVAFAKTGNYTVTGCADSFVLASCFDSYFGSQVRELCCATCSAAPCADHDDAIIGFVAAGTWSGQKVSVTGCSDPFVSAHCFDDQVGGTFSSLCCSTCGGLKAMCADHDAAAIEFVAAGTWSGQKVSVTGCSDPFVSAHCFDDQVGEAIWSLCCSTCSGGNGSGNESCVDDDAGIVAIAQEEGKAVTGCADPYVVSSCYDGFFLIPEAKERCCATCSTPPQSACVDNDTAVVAFADTGNTTVTGCSDPLVTQHCADEGVGRVIRLLCCSTCSNQGDKGEKSLGGGGDNGTVSNASATDDPHVTSLTGERFQIGAPSLYTLLRLPKNEQVPALLEVRANISEDPQSPCKLYIKSIEVTGKFMQGGVAQVLPLARDKQGSNTAGGATERPFTLVTTRAGSGAPPTSTSWDRAKKEWATGHALSSKVTVRAEMQAELKHFTEGQVFDFVVGPGTHIVVQQAAHQALNVKLAGAGNLGVLELGGLLGTGRHSLSVEEPTEECLATRTRRTEPQPLEDTMTLRASW